MIEAKTLGGLKGIRHCFFTREGGVSEGIYSSLNCGFGSKDNSENVAENRFRAAKTLGVAATNLITPFQTHSAVCAIADKPWDRKLAPKADSIVTNSKGFAIGILTADCAPVLFADPERGIIGAAHAGWRGAFAGILEATLDKMVELGASRERVYAVVGPALSQDAYEVSFDFQDNFLLESPENACFFRHGETDRPYFDLSGYCARRLTRAGVTQIEDLSLCTYGSESHFFSYRRATHRNEFDYGRQISAIMVE